MELLRTTKTPNGVRELWKDGSRGLVRFRWKDGRERVREEKGVAK